MEFVITYVPVIGTGIFLAAFTVLYLAKKFLKSAESIQSITIKSMRITLGLVLLLAGNEKLTGMSDIIGPHYLITELDKYGLGLFGQFIAFSQIIIGFGLLSNRLGALGDVMAFPMFLNILIVTISLEWQGTPGEVMLFLTMNGLLILSNWHRIKFLITDDISEIKQVSVKRNSLKLDVIYGSILIVILIGIAFKETNIELTKKIVAFGFLCLLALFVGRAVKEKMRNR